MTFADLRRIVLAFVSRQESSFQSGDINLVDVAINNALVYAQRQHDFEWNKRTVRIPCNPTGLLSDAFDIDASAPVKLKHIIKAFGTTLPEIGEEVSVPYLSRTSQVADTTEQKQAYRSCSEQRVIHHGQKLYALGVSGSEFDLYFDAVIWLPPFEQDSDTNFLLDYGRDFMIYRTVRELNFFIKEDERFQISAAMLQDAWQSLKNWDATLISPTETEIEL